MDDAVVTWKGRIIPSAKISSAGEESKLLEVWNSNSESKSVVSLLTRPDDDCCCSIVSALSDWPISPANDILAGDLTPQRS